MIIRGSHGWLFGDREQAIAELDELAGTERGPGVRDGRMADDRLPPMTVRDRLPGSKKSRKAHARFRDGWFSRLASIPTLSASDLATGLTLMLHMNRKSAPSMAVP